MSVVEKQFRSSKKKDQKNIETNKTKKRQPLTRTPSDENKCLIKVQKHQNEKNESTQFGSEIV